MYKIEAPNLEASPYIIPKLFTTRSIRLSPPTTQEVGSLTFSWPNVYDLKSISD